MFCCKNDVPAPGEKENMILKLRCEHRLLIPQYIDDEGDDATVVGSILSINESTEHEKESDLALSDDTIIPRHRYNCRSHALYEVCS